jgi:hypothetical protein
MRKIVLILWITVLVGLGAASAQQTDHPDCEFQPTREILVDLIQETQDWQQLEQFSRDLAESLAFCRGLLFEGSGSQVVGPAHLPPGQYTLHLGGDALITVEGIVIEGNCDAEGMFMGIQEGQSAIEQPFNSSDCHTTFNVETSGNWTLRFEPVNVLSTDVPSGGRINYGAQVAGQLAPNSVVEYLFDAAPGDIVTISALITQGDADLYLDLFVNGGDLVASNDDSNPEGIFNPRIAAFPVPTGGEYRIVVRHCSVCSTETTGTFTLTLDKIN